MNLLFSSDGSAPKVLVPGILQDMEIQRKRMEGLHDYGVSKSEIVENLPRLIDTISLGTNRILDKTKDHIVLLETIAQTLGKKRKIESCSPNKIEDLKEKLERVKDIHLHMLSLEKDGSYIEKHGILSTQIAHLFAEVTEQTRMLEIEIREKIPNDPHMNRIFLNLKKSLEYIRGLLAEATKLASIGMLSISIAFAGTNTDAIQASTPNNISTILDISTDQNTKASLVESKAFRSILENLKKGIAPEVFFKRGEEIARSIEEKEILQETYESKKEIWKSWNEVIVKGLFPSAEKLSDEDNKKIIGAIQGYLDVSMDGKFGPQSRKEFIKKFSEQRIQKSVIEKKTSQVKNNIYQTVTFPNDKPLESEAQFRSLYSPLIQALGEQLNIGNNKEIGAPLIMSIIAKESAYGQNLKSTTGSTGITQLTKWPFADMKGETIHAKKKSKNFSEKFDIRKVAIYQEIFQRIDLEKIKNTPFGNDGKTLANTLSDDIWNQLEIIQNGSYKEMSDAVHALEQHEKGSIKNNYLHTLNIIIGSVYLARIGDIQANRKKGGLGIDSNDVVHIAKRYNGDVKHPEVQKYYARSVQGKFQQEVAI